MTLVVGEDSYYILAELVAYCVKMGYVLPGDADDQETGSRRAAVWLDATFRNQFPGTRLLGRAQEREWPRADAEDIYGDAIPNDEIPVQVKYGQMEAALREIAEPGSLSPDWVGSEQIKMEKTGPLTTEYFARGGGTAGSARPILTTVADIMGPILNGRGNYAGLSGRVVRG